MLRFLPVLIVIILSSCHEKETPKSDKIYFAGEIVNPTSNYVVLYHNDEVVDSAKLNENNHFVFELDNVDEGLHHFEHTPELQYVYLEKGDSILLRLNTAAFDESLVFSGSNGALNNFLIEMFIAYEKEEGFVHSMFKLAPNRFSNKIDSLHNDKMLALNELSQREKLTQRAKLMAKAAVDYNSFIYKEKYPFYHKKYANENLIYELDSTFYSHRQRIHGELKELTYFRPYYDYHNYLFSNVSYSNYESACETKNNNHYVDLSKNKVNLIDSLVEDIELKNNLLRSVVVDVLLKEHKRNEACDGLINVFKNLSSNTKHHEEVDELYEGIKNLQPNVAIPNLELVTFDDKRISLKEVADSDHTVFYFWSNAQKRHFKKVIDHVEELKNKHPKTRFVGISVMTSKEKWIALLEEADLDTNNQFWSNDMDEVRNTLIVDGLNKCVIVKDSLIENGFGNLYNSL